MKKVLLIVALLTLSLVFTYGQASVSGWGRGIFAPIIMEPGEDPVMIDQCSWGWGGPRLGWALSGSSENVGAHCDILFDNGAVGIGDQTKIWVKPHEMLTLSLGRAWDTTLRGNAGFVANNWLRYGQGLAGDDYIFQLINANFIAAATPVDGLFLAIAFNGIEDSAIILEDVAETGQYAAGFDIPGIGMIRAQYYWAGRTDWSTGVPIDYNWGCINAAFKLTAVEGLMADLGFRYNLDDTAEGSGGETMNIALYANYVMDTLTLHLAGDVGLSEGDPIWKVGLGVEYGMDSGPTIQGDVRYNSDSKYAVAAFAKWSYSNGVFGIGAELTNGNFVGNIPKVDGDAIMFAIPIRLEFWF